MSLDQSTLLTLRRELREEEIPYFSEDDLSYYYEKNAGDLRATVYELLILKSEDSSISVSGLTTQDTSSYFKRLASRFRTFNSGVLRE